MQHVHSNLPANRMINHDRIGPQQIAWTVGVVYVLLACLIGYVGLKMRDRPRNDMMAQFTMAVKLTDSLLPFCQETEGCERVKSARNGLSRAMRLEDARLAAEKAGWLYSTLSRLPNADVSAPAQPLIEDIKTNLVSAQGDLDRLNKLYDAHNRYLRWFMFGIPLQRYPEVVT